ncbi:rod shape-determining protein MreD [Paenibacillus darwinianus]|uniref:Rod shape-determining protein MreD n=1 Tax=Paenibacillus darwinianus TaxID=1380763 RepID=A0A9W5W6H6_9BACL|nr:rod shape-determining protein MreD [Paenibacillus darwinianus]EXX85135.1 rod shape-determining protein MreD [Paenibacillus darwinianus]EXX90080.1 rod shape-determining protein MreD [Paenibacillus darwinianus]EXX91354.1 rod shape-determining protein MreD [Paenibacillus darwinianus]
MNLRWAVLFMFLLFIVESTIVPWLIPDALYGRLVPHFVFVFVLYSALYTGRHTALMLGLFFGLLQDIVFYGNMLGVHAFSMGLGGYLTGLLLERKRSPLLMALSIIGFASLLYDSLVYLIYKVFRIAQEPYAYFLIDSIMPSLFLQLGFALAVYIPARRLFEGSGKPSAGQEE